MPGVGDGQGDRGCCLRHGPGRDGSPAAPGDGDRATGTREDAAPGLPLSDDLDLEGWLPGYVAEEHERLMKQYAAANEYLSRVERDGEGIPGDRDHARLLYDAAVDDLRVHDRFSQWAATWLMKQAGRRVQRMRWWGT